MKKLFYLAGAFTGLYLIFVFILFSNSVIFPSVAGELYDCSVEKNVCVEDLVEISKQYNLTVFTNEYRSTSAFSKDIVFHYLSISQEHLDGIQMGVQPSLFKSNIILYEMQNQSELGLQRFWVMQNDPSSFDGFLGALKEYNVYADRFTPLTMNAQVILADKNIEFFACMCLLLVFCMGSYYVIRNKEIAVLKLNGYNNRTISARLTKTAAIRISTGFLVTALVFLVYLVVKVPSFLSDYLRLCFYVILSLVCVLTAIWFMGAIFVNALSILPALKSDKNNRLILGFSIAFKVCVTVILLLCAKNVYNDITDLNLTTHYTNISKGNDFYYLQTSVIPDDVLNARIQDSIVSIGSDDIYNYAHLMDYSFGYDDSKSDLPIIRMSYNMLSFIPVCAEDGSILRKEDFDSSITTLLIPADLKDRTDEIVGKFSAASDYIADDSDIKVTVCYTAAGQEHSDFLDPGEIVCNAIYCLRATEMGMYFNGGRVLFNRDTVATMQERLSENKLDGGTISLMALANDYQISIANIKLKLMDDLQFLIVNLLSFVLSVIAIGIVYCELRKKEISVYQMLSVYPKRVILHLSVINIIVTLVLVFIICPVYFFVVIPEFLIYFLVFNNYRSRKVLSVLKGE